MFQKVVRKSGLSVALFLSLFLGMVLPAQAASQPVITQVDVLSGRRIELQINFLPANTEFTVTESPAGSQGIGAHSHLIAHFNSLDGGTKLYWFEVLSNINTDATIDVRIDSGTGIFAFATVVNTGTFTPPTTIPVSSVPVSSGTTPVPVSPVPAAPVPGQPTVSTIGQISIVKVEMGGIVAVNLWNLPTNTSYTVTIGPAGSLGIGGSKVGGLTTPSGLTQTTSTFEIPASVRYNSVLDLRLDSGSSVYVIEFTNQNFNN